MVHGIYESVLEEIGGLLGGAELKPDKNGTCLVKMPSELRVYVEMDESADFLIIASHLGDPGVGVYRDDLFRAALQANGGTHPLHGILGWSDVTNELMLYEKISLQDINGDRVLERLAPFEEKAVLWRDAITNNEVPIVETVHTGRRLGTGMFGMQP